MCASVRVPVPGTDQLVWAQIDPEPFEGRPLLSQAAAARLCRWSIDWERRDRSKLYYKGGRSPSIAAARWEAQWVIRRLLTDPYRAKSPTTGEP